MRYLGDEMDIKECECCRQQKPLHLFDGFRVCFDCITSGKVFKEEQRRKEQLLEKLAELEHKQWEHWSKATIDYIAGEPDGWETRKRVLTKHHEWLEQWKPYEDLTEEQKEKDREWARKVLKIIFSIPSKDKSLGILEAT
jgi:hypothetical protein